MIDLVYDANYTNSFSIPLSSLITNDKDLVAGTNTNLTGSDEHRCFFSDKTTKTTSVDDDAKMTVTVDGDNLIISPSNSWVYSVDGVAMLHRVVPL